jgi:proteic killer suppression protein
VYRYTVHLRVIRSFRHRGLKRLHERGDFSKLNPDQAERIGIALADLNVAKMPQDLDLPGYRLHPLKGELKGFWSIWISANWRITFRFEDGDVCDVDLVDYH